MGASPSPDDEMLRRFGVSALRPAQRAAFEAVVTGRDVLVILPTGGGKSLCYQLPAACGVAPAIVVSPLVALMKDQVDALRRRGVRAFQLSGAVSQRERDEGWAALAEGALDLLYLAPEALASRRTRDRLAGASPRLLAVDEAHCISEWGESFRPAYLSLGTVRAALGGPPCIALTATATPRTARDIVSRLALRDPLILAGGFDRANLRLHVRRIPDEHTRRTVLLELVRRAPGPAVMYAATRRGTERLAAAIRRLGIAAAPFHAGLPSSERARLQDHFQSNALRVIVATNAFGMGVDKPDVRLVAHAEPPLTLEAYYQEAGRGGRDGAVADCHLLVGPQDLARGRARIAAARVPVDLLRRLVTLLGAPDARPHLAAETESALARLAHALGVGVHDASSALRLLSEDGVIAPGGDHGIVRIVATAHRLATDRTLDSGDVEAVTRLVSLAGDSSGRAATVGRRHAAAPREVGCSVRIARRAFDAIAPDGDGARLLTRLHERQLAVWTPDSAPWRLQRMPSDALLERLAARHATRQGRDLWRHGEVARFVETTRCRRLVLLRYFGDSGPTGSCGACDVCGFTT